MRMQASVISCLARPLSSAAYILEQLQGRLLYVCGPELRGRPGLPTLIFAASGDLGPFGVHPTCVNARALPLLFTCEWRAVS